MERYNSARVLLEPTAQRNSMPVFPPEIFDVVLELLRGDQTALKACLLTSRDWSASCRHHLYQNTKVDLRGRPSHWSRGVASFLTFLHDCPDVGPYIRNLTLIGGTRHPFGASKRPGNLYDVDLRCIKALLSLVVNLTSLWMERLYLRVRLPPECTYPVTSDFTPPRSLHQLSLQDCSILRSWQREERDGEEISLNSCRLLVRLISLFKTIEIVHTQTNWIPADPSRCLEAAELESSQDEPPLDKAAIRSLSIFGSFTSYVLTSCMALEKIESLSIFFRDGLDHQSLSHFVSGTSALQKIDINLLSLMPPSSIPGCGFTPFLMNLGI